MQISPDSVLTLDEQRVRYTAAGRRQCCRRYENKPSELSWRLARWSVVAGRRTLSHLVPDSLYSARATSIELYEILKFVKYKFEKYHHPARHLRDDSAEQELRASDVELPRKKTATLPNPDTRSVPSVGVIATIVLPPDFAREIRHCRLQSYRGNEARDRGKRKNDKNCEVAAALDGKGCGIDSTIPLILIRFEGAMRDDSLCWARERLKVFAELDEMQKSNDGEERKRYVESGGQTRPGYSRAEIENGGGRSATPKSISSIPEIHCKATDPVLLALCLLSVFLVAHARKEEERRESDIARLQARTTHRTSNCKLVKTRETLDKYAASKYKDRLFEDGFAGIRSEPGRIKEARARMEKKLRRGKRDSPFSRTRNSCLQVIIPC
ncbi:hypothetical protein ALC62_02675 [Cyphomyrmex costatus]|uniref:Uncharacterized protein n=1 Tax=Cyphomyrmex costatus TaxID=456900 RepID=A0A195D092_9HYME|nr:hypothetical protein ALC62_02675 [Cyphomyrmex costatus]